MAAGAKVMQEYVEPKLAEAASLRWTLERPEELGITHACMHPLGLEKRGRERERERERLQKERKKKRW
ncbi:hypothetical protein RIF29_42506 [Crotalaria pallida]|uniref:Uncharacterized protein n=1 Tax=Crotalaria pallida TaxID=3830 RepID=A0AAN9HSF3_CROPI